MFEKNISISENIDLSHREEPTLNSREDLSVKEGFVIKRKSSDNVTNIVQKMDIKQLLSEYPMFAAMKNIEKRNSPLLYISEQAEKEIKTHISWQKKTCSNVHEQGGILIGKPFLIGDFILGIVEHVIPADVIQANSSYLKMGTETWIKMLKIYDENYKDNGLFIIGWFHTHPNKLSVFMSSTDMRTQRRFFNQNWHFSVVLNPHRRQIACFNSINADKCDYYPPNFV